MKTYILLLIGLMLSSTSRAHDFQRLELPNRELLSSEHILMVMQDSEGFLWYATEGGGLCRDDGHQVSVFRSDAAHPDLLGSNNVACIAEAGSNIIIGTFHGAYLLNKHDYSIRRLTEVDDKRVDDILVTDSTHWWLTANKKVYEFKADGQLQRIYTTGDKYISHLHCDRHGRLWASQWEGGLLQLSKDRFVSMPWPLEAAPTVLADDVAKDGLWIGTLGNGFVRYQPSDGTAVPQPLTGNNICIDIKIVSDTLLWASTSDGLQCYRIDSQKELKVIALPASAPTTILGRLSLDLRGRLLVANGNEPSFAMQEGSLQPWPVSPALSRFTADSLQRARHLTTRPTAVAIDQTGNLWFSTGKDIRCLTQRDNRENVVLSDTKDVSAMAFTADGALWLATIFGTVKTYKDGHLITDEYASNEYGDAVTSLTVDSLGRLIIAYDRYTRCYDPVNHTLWQLSLESAGTYQIELQQTRPNERWSQPPGGTIIERLPQWLTAWWMWCIYGLLATGLFLLLIHYYILRRQRREFLQQMQTFSDQQIPEEATVKEAPHPEPAPVQDEWLQSAIAQVEAHLNDDSYTVEQLSSDLCMSRMTFYRKIQSATGQKPTEFIRTIRLRRAAGLLREGRMSISEISYATGFSSVSYFSRCFRTIYGVPPTQFMVGSTESVTPAVTNS